MLRIKLYSIFVDDQTKALRFYTEVLGFKKAREIPVGGGFRWLTVRSADEGDTELSLEPNVNPAAHVSAGAARAGYSRDGVRGRRHRGGVRAPEAARRAVHGTAEASRPGADRDLQRQLRQLDSAVSASESRLTRLLVVLRVLFVVGAEILEQIVVGLQRELQCVRERLRVGARIVDRGLDLEVPGIGPPKPLGEA
jgi:catechol 2,3-dioxygenase-like lactoylglutathione lyase family enzyme